jgi:hypothetical protein
MYQAKNPTMPEDSCHVTPSVFARELIAKMGTLYAFHALLNWSTKALDAGDIDEHRYYRAVALLVYRFSLTSVTANAGIEQVLEAGKLQPSVYPPNDSDSLTAALRSPLGLTPDDC